MWPSESKRRTEDLISHLFVLSTSDAFVWQATLFVDVKSKFTFFLASLLLLSPRMMSGFLSSYSLLKCQRSQKERQKIMEEVVQNFQSRSSLSLSFMRLSMDHNTARSHCRSMCDLEQSLVHHYFLERGS